MRKKVHSQQAQASSTSAQASTPIQRSLFRQRPFSVHTETDRDEQNKSGLRSHSNMAAGLGHNLGNMSIFPTEPAYPAVQAKVQAKLAVGQPGDKYEQEADQVAAQVLSMPSPAIAQTVQREEAEEKDEDTLQMKPLAGSITPLIQREEVEEQEEETLQTKALDAAIAPEIQREEVAEQEEEPLQTKQLDAAIAPSIQREELEEQEEEPLQTSSIEGSNQNSNNIESQLDSSKGGGSPLSKEARAFMEPRFGVDFSQVRVHTDGAAVQMNRDLNAQAFAHGSNIYFGAGKYNPSSSDGKQLLAHELTHVVQQTGGDKLTSQSENVIQNKLSVSSTSSGEQVQRDGGASAAVGLALSGLAIAQSQINGVAGGLSYKSDQVTYPNGLSQVPATAREIEGQAAEFYSYGTFVDNKTKFKLHGTFGTKTEKTPQGEQTTPVMANVYIDLAETTSYSKSELSFEAKAMSTPYGTPTNPKIRFVCSGRFDPAGFGDCNYRVVLEVDKHGNVACIDKKITSGEGKVTDYSPIGFKLTV